MVSQVVSSTENNFTKGLITEFTGLNFPENAATDTDNCIYTLVGNVTRREGIDYEENFQLNTITRTGSAINSYKWNNAGGDGETQLIVVQSGSALNFYRSSTSTVLAPLSTQLLASTVDASTFVAGGNTFDTTKECQFTDGNGYLFVYHPNCDPFFCAYDAGVITATGITIQIRDFTGVSEPGVAVNIRPNDLTSQHTYNLVNQGWTQGNAGFALTVSNNPNVGSGSKTFTLATGGQSGFTNGTSVSINTATDTHPGGVYTPAGTPAMGGTVTAYSGGTSITININSTNQSLVGDPVGPYYIVATNQGFIAAWNTAIGNYPSNADVWWYFKDNAGTFNPTDTINNITLNTGAAPSGHYLLNAFQQQRSLISNVTGITDVITTARPTNGAWFQGRVWYTGVNASQTATGNANFYTWTENIYFSQIVETPADFGSCYQTNDPTSETLFDELATDGGVITIQGAGAIYRLFPIQNGMLVFAANGVWFITGSQGIGFAANDYTITKISSVQCISSTSFVDVQGLPYFWNEEGIYSVTPSQNGSLTVDPITVGTILTFYNAIPRINKQYVRGAYHPIDYIIQWTYSNIPDTGDITARYEFDRVLNYNTYNKAFYPYSVADGDPSINGVVYVSSPDTTAPDPVFKYLTSDGNSFTFSEENDEDCVDWASSGTEVDFNSYFITGYKLHGQGQKRFQLPYIYVYSNNEEDTAYVVQSLWDYASSGRSGKWSSNQTIYNNKPYFGKIFRRHRLRGQGLVLQIKVSSVSGQPFDIMGWSTYENLNQGV